MDQPLLVDVDRRTAAMTDARVDVQVVSATPTQYHHWVTDPGAARELARLTHEAVAGHCGRRPDRLTGLGVVPQQFPSLGGETRDGKSLARGLARGWAIAMVLYGVVALSVFRAVPWYAVHPLVAGGHQDAASIPAIVAVLAPRALTIVFDLFVVVVAGKTVAPLMVDCSRIMYAWSEDRLLPAACGRTSTRQVPIIPVLVTSGLALVFLVEEATAGFQVGVALRSLTFMLVIGIVGLGWLGLRLRRPHRVPDWARDLVQRRELLFAAPAAVVVAVVLTVTGFVQTGTPLLLQPGSQALITLVVVALLWGLAQRRVRDTGAALGPGDDQATTGEARLEATLTVREERS
ncbi:APC family permease [Amycolatopsis cynarae]|uniref:APC family permease n=1 Tax=Amycolatopsis cynarae TaxID=2995223 RepID=A0ABY7B8T7_9PSEU|nr:APC family permease [Amycolatopsis sp. HUAS 11-8]WAL68777.1 APC family permease [Amycolatopsis sp. HUAS 11-8]